MSNDQRFTQWLQDYEAERIPDDMNLWNAIESQIKPTRSRTVFPRVGWLVAVLMLVMMTAGVYAFDQIINNQQGDSGMDAVTEQGKVAELYITNDFGGEYELQVTLETIYADSNRVYVAMSATGTAPTDNPISVYLNPRITLADGTELPFLGFGGGGGGGGGGGSNNPPRMPFATSLVMNYDASVIQGDLDTLALTITVDIAYNTVRNMAVEPNGMSMLGVTEFAVEVPFNRGITLTPNQTVTGETVEMTLKSLVIAPSLTRLELCYGEPAHPEGDTSLSGVAWLPIMSLSVDGETVFENQLIGQLPDTYNAETGCYTYNITFALDGYIGDWTFSVDRLVYQLIPPTDDLQQAFDDAGLPFVAMDGGAYMLATSEDNPHQYREDVPEDYEEIQALNLAAQAVFEQWQEKIEGAWTFTFTVPEA